LGRRRLFCRRWSSSKSSLGISQYRPFLVRKLRDFVLSLGTGILFFVSLGIASLDAFLPQVTLWFNFTLTAVLSRIVVFILIYAAYLLIYKYMPTTTVRWRDVWLGALLGAVMFEAVLNLFTLYLDDLPITSWFMGRSHLLLHSSCGHISLRLFSQLASNSVRNWPK